MRMSNQMNIELPRNYTLWGVILYKLGFSSIEEYTQKGHQKDQFFLHWVMKNDEWSEIFTPQKRKNVADAKNRIFLWIYVAEWKKSASTWLSCTVMMQQVHHNHFHVYSKVERK